MQKKLLLFLVVMLVAQVVQLGAIDLSMVKITGSMDVEGKFILDNDDYEGTSDLYIPNLGLYLMAQPTEQVSGNIGLYYDEIGNNLSIDVAYITLKRREECPMFITVGKIYVPSTNGGTSFISDKFTYMLAQILETTVKAEFNKFGLGIKGSLYQQDLRRENEDDCYGYVAGASYTKAFGSTSLTSGANYISDLGNTGNIRWWANGGIEEVAALNVYTDVTWKKCALNLEYVTALDELEVHTNHIEEGSTEALTPVTMHIELTHQLFTPLQIGLKYDTSEDLDGLLAETCYGGVVNYTFAKSDLGSAKLRLEYLHEVDYDEREKNQLRARISLAF